MISVNMQNIAKADADEFPAADNHPAFGVVTLFTENNNINEVVRLFLPAGTAAAVAACINVAVAAGAQAAAMEAAE